jgi:hypothetical protein
MPVSEDPNYAVAYNSGVLDAAAVIYPSALAVKTRDPRVKAALREKFGGRVEPTRWITRSVKQRRAIYASWLAYSRSPERRAAIKVALYDLEHPGVEPSAECRVA